MTENKKNLFNEDKEELERIIKNTNLDKSTKELMKKSLSFGYQAAFMARTNDIIERPFEAAKYIQAYLDMEELLKKE
jgi:hypothetical protein